jgi:hypothetical protein
MRASIESMSQEIIEQMKFFQRFFGEQGKPVYSDELCGRLLAYAALSGTEDVVLNVALNAAIQVAGDTFNIKGGEVPHQAKMRHMWHAMQELRDIGTAAPWWPSFAERYHIPKDRWKMLDGAFKAMAEYFQGPNMEKKHHRVRGDEPKPLHPVIKTLHRLRGDDDEFFDPTTGEPLHADGPWAEGWDERNGLAGSDIVDARPVTRRLRE